MDLLKDRELLGLFSPLWRPAMSRRDRLILRVLEYLLLSFFFQGCWAVAEPTAETKPVQSHPTGWRCNVFKTAQGKPMVCCKFVSIKQDSGNKKQIKGFKLHFNVFNQCWISIIAKNKVGVEQNKVWKGEKEQSTPIAKNKNPSQVFLRLKPHVKWGQTFIVQLPGLKWYLPSSVFPPFPLWILEFIPWALWGCVGSEPSPQLLLSEQDSIPISGLPPLVPIVRGNPFKGTALLLPKVTFPTPTLPYSFTSWL